MNYALLSLSIPLFCGLVLLLYPRHGGLWVTLSSTLSLAAAVTALGEVVDGGNQTLLIGGWGELLAIRLYLEPINTLLLAFTALINLLVILYWLRNCQNHNFWALACFLHATLAALWLSGDLFNWYVTLELLSLVSVAMVALAGSGGIKPALNYLFLSLLASLCYLLGVAMIYGRYGILDFQQLAGITVADTPTAIAMVLMSLGLMLKGALWPLHLWLPAAHSRAPTAVSALLSALVVKGPLFILSLLWTQMAPPELAEKGGEFLAVMGILALLIGGWCSFRTPLLKEMVAYSTVAQLGYVMLALGLMLQWQLTEMLVALWLFVLAHGLAKSSMFLAAGEMQKIFGNKRVTALRGASQTAPVAMFTFAVAGGSLIGLPPSGGFLAKWLLLQPLFTDIERWPLALAVLLSTLVSAAYVFRIVTLSFDRAERGDTPRRDPISEWLAMIPALLVWGMALVSEPLILWLTRVAE